MKLEQRTFYLKNSLQIPPPLQIPPWISIFSNVMKVLTICEEKTETFIISWSYINYATEALACRKLFRSNEFVLKTLKLSCSLPEVKYASSRKYLQHALKSNLAFSRYSFLFAATRRKCFSQESLLRNIIIFFVAKSTFFLCSGTKRCFLFFVKKGYLQFSALRRF